MVELACGMKVPTIGQGTWHIGDDPRQHDEEVAALVAGVEAGMTLIDTAEMYGYGKSERVVGDALRELEARGVDRSDLTIVSKVLPENAGEPDIFASCDASLERLGTDYLDLYLLHWRGMVPLAETVRCMEELVASGKIRAWGVSNFDIDDMEELWEIPGGKKCQVNQVLYHPASRGTEFALLPWMRRHGVALMAYCPLAQGGDLRRDLLVTPEVLEVARRHDAAPAQVVLAWDVRGGNTVAIPKAARSAHALENAGALTLELTDEDLALIERAFPAPDHKMPLDVQ